MGFDRILRTELASVPARGLTSRARGVRPAGHAAHRPAPALTETVLRSCRPAIDWCWA